ncbi:MAG: sporulation protein YabP [Syntrophomonadaceae bacterium]|jgi:sporulation protein YabP|nr:sporulation protein YabP [Syntrophomonadaceae bacterium]
MSEHSLLLLDRRTMEISGVINVNTFDEEEIILETVMGYLYVQGEELHVSMLNLEQGKVVVEGSIINIQYKKEGKDIKTRGKNILSRLLK